MALIHVFLLVLVAALAQAATTTTTLPPRPTADCEAPVAVDCDDHSAITFATRSEAARYTKGKLPVKCKTLLLTHCTEPAE
jgi:hypothetical protein